jgi:hypothetical protein
VAKNISLGHPTWDEATQFMRRCGWKMLGQAANLTSSGGFSAGVFDAVRDWCGLHWQIKDQLDNAIGRIASVVVEIPGYISLVIHSVYMQVNTGVCGLNLNILATLGERIQDDGRPWIFAGDFNFLPTSFSRLSWLGRVRGNILASIRAACVTQSSATILDYFVVSDVIKQIVELPVVGSCLRSSVHRPVNLEMHPNPRSIMKQVLFSA